MQYMLLIYGDEKLWTNQSPADLQKSYQEYIDYSEALAQSGAMVGGSELKPISTATTVRIASGKTTVTDGPFAETKEQLGGYYLIEAATLDEAIKWAERCPGAKWGSVEVRPLAPNG